MPAILRVRHGTLRVSCAALRIWHMGRTTLRVFLRFCVCVGFCSSAYGRKSGVWAARGLCSGPTKYAQTYGLGNQAMWQYATCALC